MPPHCDSMDGPVVTAAANALSTGDPRLVLPFVPEDGEREVLDAFERTCAVRPLGRVAQELADRYFFETVVRIHRAGEGAAFTGLKPAGLDVGPVIPVAECAIADGTPDDLIALLTNEVETEIRDRFAALRLLKARANGDVHANREYVEAMLGLEVWSHSLYGAIHARAHARHQLDGRNT